MTSLLTHVVYIEKIRREERFWGGDNPRKVTYRKKTFDKEVGELLGNVVMPVACSVKRIMTSRGISLDARVIRRLKGFKYKSPSSQNMSDMEAFIALNSLQKLITVSQQFATGLEMTGLL